MNYVANQIPLRKNAIPNSVLGIIFLITTEVMFFGGLISAYIVNRAGSSWPPVNQPRLPVEATALNTFFLLLSAWAIYKAGAIFERGNMRNQLNSMWWLLGGVILGVLFVAIQGVEWVRLIQFGLTTTSSLYGAFFYIIIGAHGIHVIVGLILLMYWYSVLFSPNTLEAKQEKIMACSIYWYFVVGIWPVLYVLVYLV